MNRQKDITIYDIARELQLSAATVSRALMDHKGVNKHTKHRVFEQAEKMGYRSNRFASNLRRQHTRTIGVIIHELNSHFITSVLAGIEKVITQAGYDLIIGHSSETSAKEVANADNFFHKRVDGLLVSLAYDTTDFSHFDPFIERHIPIVFFDRVENSIPATRVIIDNVHAGYIATEHLIMQGCTHLAHVTASLKRNVYADRLKGFKNALSDYSLPFEKSSLFVNDLSEEDAVDAALKIIHMKHRPDGVFITNDFCAAVMMRVFKDHGVRVPEDIAIVGFNNDIVSKIVTPHLTTVNYPGFEMGEIAAGNLISHLGSNHPQGSAPNVVIKSELVVRQSSVKKP